MMEFVCEAKYLSNEDSLIQFYTTYSHSYSYYYYINTGNGCNNYVYPNIF